MSIVSPLEELGIYKSPHPLPPMRTLHYAPAPRYIRPGAEVEWKTLVPMESRRGTAPPLPAIPKKLMAQPEPSPVTKRTWKTRLKKPPKPKPPKAAIPDGLITPAEAARNKSLGMGKTTFMELLHRARRDNDEAITRFIVMTSDGRRMLIVKEKFEEWIKARDDEDRKWITGADAHERWPVIIRDDKFLADMLSDERCGRRSSFGLQDCVVGRDRWYRWIFDPEKLEDWVKRLPENRQAERERRAMLRGGLKAVSAIKNTGGQKKLIDLTCKRFGRWTVIKRAENTGRNKAAWLCKCDCGTEKVVTSELLRSGDSRSCGCLARDLRRQRLAKQKPEPIGQRRKPVPGRQAIDISGWRFGRLTAIEVVGVRNTKAIWRCACDCGNEREASGNLLRNGHVLSCGCLEIDQRRDAARELNKDLINKRFTRLTVIGIAQEKPNRKHIKLECLCDCGNRINVDRFDLLNNRSRSCGCLRNESAALLIASINAKRRESKAMSATLSA